MKRIFLKILCSFCAVTVLLSCLSFGLFEPVNADEPVGKMSSIYGYILNDYIETYGVLSTADNGAIFDSNGNEIAPCGVVYGDILNFDNNLCPYLVIFVANSEYKTSSCHIWLYNDETEKAQRIAIIEKKYDTIPPDEIGEFNIGWKDDKRYITFRTYENNIPKTAEFYTVVNGEAYMYLNNPENVSESGIMDFNSHYFHPGVDVSDYNKSLSDFFSKLKDAAANSVSYENIARKLSGDDKTNLNRALIYATLYQDFDIVRYDTLDEYRSGLSVTTSGDKFTQLTALYDLGEELYYAKFDTNKSKYNYALLRKSDEADNGYQILKVRTDCIPLSDRELRQLRLMYMQNPLLMPKSDESVKLKAKADASPTPSNITVKVGGKEAVSITPAPASAPAAKEKPLKIKKLFDDRIKIPAACTGGGIALGLLVFLWVYMSDDD